MKVPATGERNLASPVRWWLTPRERVQAGMQKAGRSFLVALVDSTP